MLQRSLRIIHASKLVFDKSGPVDEAQRQELAKFLKESKQEYSEEERSTWTGLRQQLDGLDDSEFEVVPTGDRCWKVMRAVKKVRTAKFRAIATIDAPLEVCASYEIMKMTRERLENHYSGGVGLRRGGENVRVVKCQAEDAQYSQRFVASLLAPRYHLTPPVIRRSGRAKPS